MLYSKFIGSAAQPLIRYTPADYYRIERDAPHKSDYYDGEIFAMGGGSIRHSLICSNVIREVGNRLKGTPCIAYESNLRLKVKATGLRTYPDASIYCGPLERDEEDPDGQTVTNPAVLFEVLSKTTEAYGRGLKCANFRRIESLQAYVLTLQEQPHVEWYERQPDGSWTLREARGLDGALTIHSPKLELPLAEVYAGAGFLP